MDWLDDVKKKIKRKNQILFSKDSEYLQELTLLINEQNHRVLVLWAFDFAEKTVQKLEAKYPHETRPSDALKVSRLWALGKVRMPAARRAILNCHACAKGINIPADIALYHAVGQACSVVHTKGHAIGFPIYDLTALVYELGIENCRETVEKRKQEYIDRLLYWKNHYQDYPCEWADFMLR